MGDALRRSASSAAGSAASTSTRTGACRSCSRWRRSATSTRRRPARSAAAYGIGRVVADVGALCRQDDLDVVDLCTPPYLHAAQTLQVLAAGQARHLREAALRVAARTPTGWSPPSRRSGRRVMPIFQYRFGHGIQKLRLLVERGIAGRAYLDDGGDRVAAAAGLLRGALAVALGDGARRPGGEPRHPRPRPRLLRAGARAERVGAPHDPREPDRDGGLRRDLARDGGRVALHARGDHRLGSRDQPAPVLLREPVSAESNTAPVPELARSLDVHRRHAGGRRPASGKTLADVRARARGVCRPVRPVPPGASVRGPSFPVTLADARASIELITAIYHSARTRAPVRLPLDAAHPLYGAGSHPAPDPARGERRGAPRRRPPPGQASACASVRHRRACDRNATAGCAHRSAAPRDRRDGAPPGRTAKVRGCGAVPPTRVSTLASAMKARVFLLSPAHCGGERARLVLRERARFDLAQRLRTRRALPSARCSAS